MNRNLDLPCLHPFWRLSVLFLLTSCLTKPRILWNFYWTVIPCTLTSHLILLFRQSHGRTKRWTEANRIFAVVRSILWLICLYSTNVANLVLLKTQERIYSDKAYASIDRGVFLVKGENLVLLGEWRDERDRFPSASLLEVINDAKDDRLNEEIMLEYQKKHHLLMEMEPETFWCVSFV